MKLIFCPECEDLFRLTQKSRHCECGKSKGVYLSDRVTALLEGPSIPVGISNRGFVNAIKIWKKNKGNVTFEAFTIPDKAKTIVRVPA